MLSNFATGPTSRLPPASRLANYPNAPLQNDHGDKEASPEEGEACHDRDKQEGEGVHDQSIRGCRTGRQVGIKRVPSIPELGESGALGKVRPMRRPKALGHRLTG